MLEIVKHTIETHQMLTPGEAVLVALSGGADSTALLRALLLLAALGCGPSLVLTGSEWLPELTGAVENYVPFWKGLLRFLIFCAWCWVWLWTEGSALQILLALLLQFCGIWALCLLRPRPASRAHSHA